MKYTYQYHAMQFPEMGTTNHYDGVITFNCKIKGSGSYEALRDALAEKLKLEPDELTICSLTLLHSEDE